MIDFSNEILTYIKEEIIQYHGERVEVLGEHVEVPSKFPCVTIEESFNIPSHRDNGPQEYADVTYRVQVFSNKEFGKRAEARELFSTVADALYDKNLIQKTFIPTPSVYRSEIYQIEASFEAVIDKDGNIYRR